MSGDLFDKPPENVSVPALLAPPVAADPWPPTDGPRCGTCAKWREHLSVGGSGIGFGKCKMINRARMTSQISKCRFTPTQHIEKQLEKSNV